VCYSLWYNAPTMLLASNLEVEVLPTLPGYHPATSWVHYTTSCNTQSSAPEDWRDQRPKHVELIGIINKSLLLHLVGVYIIYPLFAIQQHFNFTPCYLLSLAHQRFDRQGFLRMWKIVLRIPSMKKVWEHWSTWLLQ